MQYSDYSVEDFASDPYFEQWVTNPNADSNRFWEIWLTHNPHKRAIVNEARQLVLLMSFKPTKLEEDREEALLNRIHRTLGKEQGIAPATSRYPNRFFVVSNTWLRMAAVFTGLLIVAVSVFFFLQFNPTTTYTTSYGQIRTITLPDNSVVTLNANSRLTLVGDWNTTEDRKVSLEGEAYFSVVHTDNHQRFIVATSGNSHIEVLGTKFNVNNRRGHTKVLLNSGKVQLNLEADNQVKKVVMQPGELLEVSGAKEITTKQVVKTEMYTAWRNNLLTFDDAPLWQIAQTLEDNYGLTVEIADPALAQRRYTGSTPADKVDILLTKLSKIFDATVTSNGNHILLKSNNH